jgi:hypothetical protein
VTQMNVEELYATGRSELRRQVAYLDQLTVSMHHLLQHGSPFEALERLRECYTTRAGRVAGFLDEYGEIFKWRTRN